MATISLCMIVKDEEAVLARCLESVKAGVDEIIIVDTGSSDRTREIAARYTDKVYDFPWIDDFSAARNFSFSKATMDFSMWLDADDVFTEKDLELFKQQKEDIPDSTNVIMLRYNTGFDETGKPVFSFYRERLLRNSKAFVWKGRVHEAVEYSGPVLYWDIAVTHRSVKRVYSDRNLRIYEKQLADGEPLSPRDWFYYGRELYYHKRYEKAMEVLNNFLGAGRGWVENNIEACKILAACYREQGDPLGALEALARSFRYDLPRAEICCEMGSVFMEMGAYEKAAFWYGEALRVPRDDQNGAFVAEDCHGYLPSIQLCVCYDRLGDRWQAQKYNNLAGTFKPDAPAYLQNVGYFARLGRNP